MTDFHDITLYVLWIVIIVNTILTIFLMKKRKQLLSLHDTDWHPLEEVPDDGS